MSEAAPTAAVAPAPVKEKKARKKPAAAALPKEAPARSQPERRVKKNDYKEEKKKALEAERKLAYGVKHTGKKAVNYQKYVLEAVTKLSGKGKQKGVGVVTVTKAVRAATGSEAKKLQASVRVALNVLRRKGQIVALAAGKKFKPAKESKKKAVMKKAAKKVSAKKIGAPKKKAVKKAPKKVKAKAAAAPKKKAVTKKKKAVMEEEAPEAAAAAAPKKRAKKAAEAGSDEPHWEYRDGGWKRYDAEASAVVETAFQEYLRDPGMLDVRSVKSGSWSYQVDFVNMKQTNIEHTAHTVRDIRRVPEYKKPEVAAPAPAAPAAAVLEGAPAPK